MNLMIAPATYLLTGFAKGHYTRHRGPRLARVSVGRNCVGGISFQWHSGTGIRYADLVLWKWKPWISRMKMGLSKQRLP